MIGPRKGFEAKNVDVDWDLVFTSESTQHKMSANPLKDLGEVLKNPPKRQIRASKNFENRVTRHTTAVFSRLKDLT